MRRSRKVIEKAGPNGKVQLAVMIKVGRYRVDIPVAFAPVVGDGNDRTLDERRVRLPLQNGQARLIVSTTDQSDIKLPIAGEISVHKVHVKGKVVGRVIAIKELPV